LHELLTAQGGYPVVWHHDTYYHPERWHNGHHDLQGVAFLNVCQLETEPEIPLRTLARLIDHLLGSLCQTPVAYISEGTCVSRHWTDFYPRLLSAYELGYANDEQTRQSPSEYFCWAFSCYCLDKRLLSATDPQAYRLLHSTLFSESYWRSHPLQDDHTVQSR